MVTKVQCKGNGLPLRSYSVNDLNSFTIITWFGACASEVSFSLSVIR